VVSRLGSLDKLRGKNLYGICHKQKVVETAYATQYTRLRTLLVVVRLVTIAGYLLLVEPLHKLLNHITLYMDRGNIKLAQNEV